jgi:hypothetical protein
MSNEEGKVGPTLRAALESDEAGCANVLIEVATPQPQVVMEEAPPGAVGGWRPAAIATDPNFRDREAVADQARQFLEEILGPDLVWLPASQAFVADIDRDQLEVIAGSPLVRSVHLNRRLR